MLARVLDLCSNLLASFVCLLCFITGRYAQKPFVMQALRGPPTQRDHGSVSMNDGQGLLALSGSSAPSTN
jgi:hypothetical protein